MSYRRSGHRPRSARPTRSTRRKKLIRKLPAADVLLCHCPPRGVNDDPDDPAHIGFEALRDWVLEHRPRWLLHGHVHPQPGQRCWTASATRGSSTSTAPSARPHLSAHRAGNPTLCPTGCLHRRLARRAATLRGMMTRPRPHRSRRPRGRRGHRPDRLRPVPRRRPAAVGQRPLQGRRRLPLDRQRSASPRSGYAITTPNLEVGAGAPGFLLKADRYGDDPPDRRRPRAASRCSSASPAPATSTPTCAASPTARSPTSTTPRSSARYTPATAARASPAAPAAQHIWAAEPAPHSLHWNVQSGDWSVVVMNADGSRGVSAAVSAGAQGPLHRRVRLRRRSASALLFIIATAALTRLRHAPASVAHASSCA